MREDKPAYEPKAVEAEWQRRWAESQADSYTDQELESAEKPFYNLMMFPYPSAEGLHVGNVYAFTGADVYGRYRRLQGDQVFEPIGFDAFGIHSENYALKVDTHPMELIPRNIANFTRQLKRLGAMYDWSHTVDTTDPEYYRWTQWLFLQLLKHGLAEKKKAPVNWCPSCHTVLANEQVVAGACERCSTAVEQRFIAQWFFKITSYAQRLLDNLDWIDWSESTKKAQENWIGRSEGAQLVFPIKPADKPETESDQAGGTEQESIRVFTTRPDTLFGATFMVLAPEHPLVKSLTSPEQRSAVQEYQRKVSRLDLVARQKEEEDKTGVFTGGYCVNPATGEPIPVWIADYVLMQYGTGAIMAVPGHDERDFQFAHKYGLPVPQVITDDHDPERREEDYPPLAAAYTGEGVLINSGQFKGMNSLEARGAITNWLKERNLAEPQVNYRLHDWCISRQRYWGPPIPIIYCDNCGTVPVPEEDLPVLLPYVEDYKPDATGTSPLARAEEWYKVPCPECNGPARRETDVSDTFLDSSWYFFRYPSANRDDVAFDKEITRNWLPVHMYIGGEEHAVLHLLYSRFITMALHDMGLLTFEEPFRTFKKHGLIIREGAKMSKSRGNVVIPDQFIEEYGSDTFRMYLMFLGPYQEGGDFRVQGIQGPYGFLNRLWGTVVPAEDLGHAPLEGKLEQLLHATIKKVTEDLAHLRYNTAIAAMMEYLNSVREGGRRAQRAEVEPLVILVAPLAPHLAEELWKQLGHEEPLFQRQVRSRRIWPDYDAAKATADEVELVIQVNGKLRARIRLPRGTTEDEAKAAALADENVRRFLDGGQLRKVIFVPDRLLNLVAG